MASWRSCRWWSSSCPSCPCCRRRGPRALHQRGTAPYASFLSCSPSWPSFASCRPFRARHLRLWASRVNRCTVGEPHSGRTFALLLEPEAQPSPCRRRWRLLQRIRTKERTKTERRKKNDIFGGCTEPGEDEAALRGEAEAALRGEVMPSSSAVIVDKFSFFLNENVLFSIPFFSPSIFGCSNSPVKLSHNNGFINI